MRAKFEAVEADTLQIVGVSEVCECSFGVALAVLEGGGIHYCASCLTTSAIGDGSSVREDTSLVETTIASPSS